MRKHEIIGSLAWGALGVPFCIGSISMGLGRLNDPGPGFFPFLMSGCLILFASIHFISLLKKGEKFNSAKSERFWPEREGFRRLCFTIVSLFLYIIAIHYLGFIMTTFLFMFFALRFVEPQKWVTVFFITSLTTGLSYAIFQLWLKTNLPEGFLGF